MPLAPVPFGRVTWPCTNTPGASPVGYSVGSLVVEGAGVQLQMGVKVGDGRIAVCVAVGLGVIVRVGGGMGVKVVGVVSFAGAAALVAAVG